MDTLGFLVRITDTEFSEAFAVSFREGNSLPAHFGSHFYHVTDATHLVEGFGFSDPPAEGSGVETSKTLPDPACFFAQG